jgi:hypothetical protein
VFRGSGDLASLLSITTTCWSVPPITPWHSPSTTLPLVGLRRATPLTQTPSELLVLADGRATTEPTSGLGNMLSNNGWATVMARQAPPAVSAGASTWNPLAPRLFSEIGDNWAGAPRHPRNHPQPHPRHHHRQRPKDRRPTDGPTSTLTKRHPTCPASTPAAPGADATSKLGSHFYVST